MGAMKIIITILTLLLIVLGVLDLIIPDSYFIQDYVRGTFTETIGIIITLVLIEVILQKNRELEQKLLAKKGVLRALDLISISLNNYNKASYDLGTPISEQKKAPDTKLNFPFTNLSELYRQSNSVIEGFNKSKAYVYFEKLDKLLETVSNALYQIDLSNYPEFSNFLLGLIKYAESYYPKNGVLTSQSGMVGNQQMKDICSDLIKNYSGPVEYKKSNIINPFIRLYQLMNFMILFDIQFISLKEKVNKEN